MKTNCWLLVKLETEDSALLLKRRGSRMCHLRTNMVTRDLMHMFKKQIFFKRNITHKYWSLSLYEKWEACFYCQISWNQLAWNIGGLPKYSKDSFAKGYPKNCVWEIIYFIRTKVKNCDKQHGKPESWLLLSWLNLTFLKGLKCWSVEKH